MDIFQPFVERLPDALVSGPKTSDHSVGVGWGLCAHIIVHTILPPRPVILWIELGGKPKWLPLNFGYHDVMHTAPIESE